MDLIMTIGTIILVIIGLIEFFRKYTGEKASPKSQISLHRSKKPTIPVPIVNESNSQLILEKEIFSVNQEQTIIQERDINIEILLKDLDHFNNEMLLVRYREKYNPLFYLSRESVFSHLKNFVASKMKLMVLTGKAGTGKSVFVCDLVKNHQQNQIFWIQDCAQLNISDQQSIDSFIGNTLGYNKGIIELFKKVTEKHPAEQLLIIFDALNEFKEKEKLLQKISEFVNQIDENNLQVLITCRIPIWNRIRRYLQIPIEKEFHSAGPNSYVNVDVFEKEEVNKVYDLYKQVYSLKTSFDSLSDQVKQFIQQPLFLKLTSESYEGQNIPESLALQEVFIKYIEKCLGKEGFESPEYIILQRAVRLMYENAVRELPVTTLKDDAEVNKYFEQISQSPYFHLIDEGLLSQKNISKSLIKKLEVVFVTYEMVFEFLLAELFIDSINEKQVVRQLEIAQSKMFSQLRGAITFAVSFSILNNKSEISILLNLAKLNKPGSRQFLIDVIHTIYQSGNNKLVYNIIDLLSNQDQLEPRILAIEASYQLHLDTKLIAFTLLKDEFLRDIASFYIYSRWNSARLNGNVNDGYNIINKLVTYINLKKPQTSYNALLAFLSVSINMGIHVIDDPESLKPLLEISRNLVQKVPGLSPDQSNKGVIKFISEKTSDIIVDVIAKYLTKLMVDQSIFANIFTDNNAKRALLDVGSLINLDELTKYKDKVIRLISWGNPSVNFSSRSVLTCQVYKNPEVHLEFLQEIYDNSDLSLQVRANILHAMIYGLISRLLNKKEIDISAIEILNNNFFELLREFLTSDKPANPELNFSSDEKRLFLASLQFLLFGLFYIEAYHQRLNGITVGSKFLDKYNCDPLLKESITVDLIIWSVEKIGYQGFVEYSILTLTNKELIPTWLEVSKKKGLSSLSNLRSVFQEQFDSFFQSNRELDDLWAQIKTMGSTLNPKDLWDVSYSIWIMVGTAVDSTIMKISGLALLDLVTSEGADDFIKKIIRTILAILKDPDRIDIAHIQYGLAHDPNWNLYSHLDINPNLLNIKPEIHEFYSELSTGIVKTLGRGLLYDEL